MSLHQFDPVIGKLTRVIMKDGKKHAALRIVDTCFAVLRTQYNIADPAVFTRNVVEMAKPIVELRKYTVGGRTIQVPTPCRPHRQQSLALRFIRKLMWVYCACGLGLSIFGSDAFRERKEFGSGLRLAKELVDLDKQTGRAYTKRDELHKRAEQNRAFAHFVK